MFWSGNMDPRLRGDDGDRLRGDDDVGYGRYVAAVSIHNSRADPVSRTSQMLSPRTQWKKSHQHANATTSADAAKPDQEVKA